MVTSSPAGICPKSRPWKNDNCDFVVVSTYRPKLFPKIKEAEVSIWRCTRCKRYACAGHYETGTTFNYNIRVCDIEGTTIFFWKDKFPGEFVKANEYLWQWWDKE